MGKRSVRRMDALDLTLEARKHLGASIHYLGNSVDAWRAGDAEGIDASHADEIADDLAGMVTELRALRDRLSMPGLRARHPVSRSAEDEV